MARWRHGTKVLQKFAGNWQLDQPMQAKDAHVDTWQILTAVVTCAEAKGFGDSSYPDPLFMSACALRSVLFGLVPIESHEGWEMLRSCRVRLVISCDAYAILCHSPGVYPINPLEMWITAVWYKKGAQLGICWNPWGGVAASTSFFFGNAGVNALPCPCLSWAKVHGRASASMSNLAWRSSRKSAWYERLTIFGTSNPCRVHNVHVWSILSMARNEYMTIIDYIYIIYNIYIYMIIDTCGYTSSGYIQVIGAVLKQPCWFD